MGEVENFFSEAELPNFSISQVHEKSSRHIVPKPVFDETQNVICETDNLQIENNSETM